MTCNNYGFIITRHVNTELANYYWNECIRSIQLFYPSKKIVVIDDNSKQEYVKAFKHYDNVEYVQSEFIGRGELLPYYYLFQKHYFDYAFILHDSVFIQTAIHFDYLIKKGVQVMPLWHFTHEKKENFNNTIRIAGKLKNNHSILTTLSTNRQYEVLGKHNKNVWTGCFGVQSFIHREFLCKLQEKYNLFNLLHFITSRSDRCCLERIVGVIFFIEYLKEVGQYSMLGDIRSYCLWGYTYKAYYNDKYITKKINRQLPVIKVWSGR